MAHIVTNKCVNCKFTDCVEVCPVACFYEMDNQVVIHPEDCIDCTACVAEFQSDTQINADESRRLKDSGASAILKKKDPLPTAEDKKKQLGY
jgi:ferredoxin